MTDEAWKSRVEKDMKLCNEHRVRLDERTISQQKEIDTTDGLLSDLYDYKNDIYRKLTENKANAVTVKDHNELATQVTRLNTEKKFLPYVIMIVSLIGTLVTAIYAVNKLTGGENVGKSRNKVEAHERLPVLRSEMSKDNQ